MTSFSTLTGYCAGAAATPFVGAEDFNNFAQGEGLYEANIQNAYDCCNDCQDGFIPYGCIGYISFPGIDGCFVVEENSSPNQSKVCEYGLEDANVYLNETLYPDHLGGPGPCAGTINVYHIS